MNPTTRMYEDQKMFCDAADAAVFLFKSAASTAVSTAKVVDQAKKVGLMGVQLDLPTQVKLCSRNATLQLQEDKFSDFLQVVWPHSQTAEELARDGIEHAKEQRFKNEMPCFGACLPGNLEEKHCQLWGEAWTGAIFNDEWIRRFIASESQESVAEITDVCENILTGLKDCPLPQHLKRQSAIMAMVHRGLVALLNHRPGYMDSSLQDVEYICGDAVEVDGQFCKITEDLPSAGKILVRHLTQDSDCMCLSPSEPQFHYSPYPVG
jgi:hypothetical protein